MLKGGLVALISSVILVGCGGSGGGNGNGQVSPVEETTTAATGVFEDSAVEGLQYVSGDISGVTNAEGEFEYLVGEQVTFSIGDIVVGSAIGAQTITPVSLVAGAVDETNAVVTNIARFLQTLDNDNNPDNGILITEDVRNLAQERTIDFDQSIFNFANDGNVQTIVAELSALTSAGARGLISQSQAQVHLSDTLIANFAGSYEGTFVGDDSGTWQFVANQQGEIVGTGVSNSIGEFSFDGTVQSSGDSVFGATNTDTVFSAVIGSDGSISGRWESLINAEGGTISGMLTE